MDLRHLITSVQNLYKEQVTFTFTKNEQYSQRTSDICKERAILTKNERHLQWTSDIYKEQMTFI